MADIARRVQQRSLAGNVRSGEPDDWPFAIAHDTESSLRFSSHATLPPATSNTSCWSTTCPFRTSPCAGHSVSLPCFPQAGTDSGDCPRSMMIGFIGTLNSCAQYLPSGRLLALVYYASLWCGDTNALTKNDHGRYFTQRYSCRRRYGPIQGEPEAICFINCDAGSADIDSPPALASRARWCSPKRIVHADHEILREFAKFAR